MTKNPLTPRERDQQAPSSLGFAAAVLIALSFLLVEMGVTGFAFALQVIGAVIFVVGIPFCLLAIKYKQSIGWYDSPPAESDSSKTQNARTDSLSSPDITSEPTAARKQLNDEPSQRKQDGQPIMVTIALIVVALLIPVLMLYFL